MSKLTTAQKSEIKRYNDFMRKREEEMSKKEEYMVDILDFQTICESGDLEFLNDMLRQNIYPGYLRYLLFRNIRLLKGE